MSKIGKIAICSVCREKKPVHEQMETGTSVRLTCQECFMKRSSCECPICKEFKTLPSYYGHLIEKHTLQELAKYMSDFEKNSKFEEW